jgi:uncharacterized protein
MNFARKRIVFDTSALIPACLYPEREPARIFRQAVIAHDIFSSLEAIKELQVVLSRTKFEVWQTLGNRLAWVKLYISVISMVELQERVYDCRDSKDNKFLETAIAAKADVLISSDIHLLELHPYRNIEILQLSEFKDKYI